MKGTENTKRIWDFFIDRGGTFTDVVTVSDRGETQVRKWLSHHPERYKDASLEAVRAFLAENPGDIAGEIRMGTTVATNALLERKGVSTALLTTAGFADILQIGNQTRKHLFHLWPENRNPLPEISIGLEERMSPEGVAELPPQKAEVFSVLEKLKAQNIESIAICFKHSYRNSAHEDLVAGWALEFGFEHVVCGHSTVPTPGFLARTETTSADAYLNPVLQQYLHALLNEWQDKRVSFMQSSGGLCEAQHFRAKDAVLSGPAGGVIGMAAVGKQVGDDQLLGFDMGGTSTDVCHYNGSYDRSFSAEINGIELSVPMLEIHTVAAGGGSILHFRDGRFETGPDSAGADPGPACYRRGGPLTLTDCQVMLGRIHPESFPAIFGPSGKEPLDQEVVIQKFQQWLPQIRKEYAQLSEDPADLAQGFVDVACETMAQAVRKISLERGYDPRNYSLCSFGGAGGQFACQIAGILGMSKILFHPMAGVLSAWGIGLAARQDINLHPIQQELDLLKSTDLASIIQDMQAEKVEQVEDLEQANISPLIFNYSLRLRYAESETTLEIPLNFDTSLLKELFHNTHLERFGYQDLDRKIMVDSLVQETIFEPEKDPAKIHSSVQDSAKFAASSAKGSVEYSTRVHWKHLGWVDTPVFQREDLGPGWSKQGPLLIREEHSTLVIEPGWDVQMDSQGILQASVSAGVENLDQREIDEWKIADQTTTDPTSMNQTTSDQSTADQEINTSTPDPVALQVFNRLFVAASEEMGVVLQQTAASVNIRERRDFSCAVFDASGRLIANAPHVPVHLGSMSASIQALLKSEIVLRQGDQYVMNDPYAGGTHLPDITVIKPVFVDEVPEFFVAARGHHADIGGVSPGSMPANSAKIQEEGVLIQIQGIIDQGTFLSERFRELLLSAEYPARNVDQNIADLRAQTAACECGERALLRMIQQYRVSLVSQYARFVFNNADRSVRNSFKGLNFGRARRVLDNGLVIEVDVKLAEDGQKVIVDFSGTSKQHEGNWNAPRAVCRAAVLYVFRCLAGHDIPLNDGCLESIELVIPEGSVLAPVFPAAVVAGNVEVSQAVVDVLLEVMGVAAASQGTMNNLSFGNASHQFYETMCGGYGAGPNHSGASAMHSHMTNSRLTDAEILELRYPVRLESLKIRKGSGGAGKQSGGDGIVRTFRFLEEMDVSLISGNRETGPRGIDGGEDGAPGQNLLCRKQQSDSRGKEGEQQTHLPGEPIQETLPGVWTGRVSPEDVLEIQTPGGGGWGDPER